MKKPKMIIFDYGHTLLCEPDYTPLRGNEALAKYIKTNKNNLTPQQITDFAQDLFASVSAVRSMDIDLHQFQFQRFLYEYLEIEFNIPMSEIEKIYWDNTSCGLIMPNADRLIDIINSMHIRSGVISNLGFSGAALSERINRLLPNNEFEFILASSEYMLRKPNPLLFELALKKARLDASDVWFCGDNIRADVEGASAVGMFPIWYDDETLENFFRGQDKGVYPGCEHLHIHDWSEMICLLETL